MAVVVVFEDGGDETKIVKHVVVGGGGVSHGMVICDFGNEADTTEMENQDVQMAKKFREYLQDGTGGKPYQETAFGYIGTKNAQKQAIIQIFMMTNAVVAASWFLLYLRTGVTVVDFYPGFGAHHFFAGQVSTSLLTNTDTVTTLRAMVMSNLTFMVHLHLCKDIVDVFQKAIDGEVPCKVNTWTLRRSGDVVLFSFNYISVAGWLVKKCQRLELLHTGEAHIAFGEFVAKIVLMLVIVNNSIEESQ
ncbi:hypothetical protein BC830DRAFT_1163136 [Chytriomyces sp. MP71]|nr:hypothetical protein BC830DRAFT_1163136 [Chytriomyces sp. MP71]